MSHLLRRDEVSNVILTRPHAAIRVEVIGKRPRRLRLNPDPENPIRIIYDVFLSPLPSDVDVVGPDGQAVVPSGRFFITNETIDPCHMLFDVFDPQATRYGL